VSPHYLSGSSSYPGKTSQEDDLRSWKTRGMKSWVMEARLQWVDAEGYAKYARMISKVERVHPDMLPMQASGRWSTVRPPLITFPPALKNCFVPDPGTLWIKYDLDAIEAKRAAYESEDEKNIQIFEKGWDIHTLTTCDFYNHPYPPNLVDPNFSPECQAWRESWNPVWGPGKDDRRRHMMKTVRYAMTYADPYGYHAVLSAKDVEKLGLTIKELVDGAKKYVTLQSHYEEWKKREGLRIAEQGWARTSWGRLRRLYGDYPSRARDGISFIISGYVSEMQNQIFRRVFEGLFPEAWLITNGHDSAQIAFPDTLNPHAVVGVLRPEVEKGWPGKRPMPVTATWELWLPDGSVTKLK
jgi:hypothetical protein